MQLSSHQAESVSTTPSWRVDSQCSSVGISSSTLPISKCTGMDTLYNYFSHSENEARYSHSMMVYTCKDLSINQVGYKIPPLHSIMHSKTLSAPQLK